MGANDFGNRFKITSFGESHGPALGVVIDGCPAGVDFDKDLLESFMERRRPGKFPWESPRQETDKVTILSGVYENITLGTPIAAVVFNENARPQDYAALKDTSRRGHADDLWKDKFGHSDHRGGGRASGRETLSRVIGGAFAQMLCKKLLPQENSLKIFSFAQKIGSLELSENERQQALHGNFEVPLESCIARFPSNKQKEVESILLQAKNEGNSLGGVAQIVIHNPPRNLGQPVFHKLKSDLAAAYMSVGAVVGVELGAGFQGVEKLGKTFHGDSSSNYGGIRGGLSTGEAIEFKVAIKPTSSLGELAIKGRHDPLILSRALPVLEAMTWLVFADHVLWKRTDQAIKP